jgi:hypothetical protein
MIEVRTLEVELEPEKLLAQVDFLASEIASTSSVERAA